MEQLKNIEQCLISAVQGQLGDLKKTNAKELGEVVDMIKDLEEAIYYCSITEAMEKSAEEKEHNNNNTPMNISYFMESGNGGGSSYYSESQPRNTEGQFMSSGRRSYVPYMEYAPYMMRDEGWRNSHMYSEGSSSNSGGGNSNNSGSRSYYSRRMYMESKSDGSDDQKSMKELEHFMKDLGEDLTDMIVKSTPEEKQVLSNKLQQLAMKVAK